MSHLFIRAGLIYPECTDIELPRVCLEDVPTDAAELASLVGAHVDALADAAGADSWVAGYVGSHCPVTLLSSVDYQT